MITWRRQIIQLADGRKIRRSVVQSRADVWTKLTVFRSGVILYDGKLVIVEVTKDYSSDTSMPMIWIVR